LPGRRPVDHRRRADDRARHPCAGRLLRQCTAPRRAHRAGRRASAPHRPLRLLSRSVPVLAVAARCAAAARIPHTPGDSSMSIKTATLNGVATIEIARPEKKNAITVDMYAAMAAALRAANADPAVRAVLITGQPGIFTSGNDLEDFMQRPKQ